MPRSSSLKPTAKAMTSPSNSDARKPLDFSVFSKDEERLFHQGIAATATETAANSLYAFVELAWHVLEPGKPFIDGWHIGAICEHLQAVDRSELSRLVICVPPRSSKSSIVSVLWPAWTWINNPSTQWLCISHSDRLAVRDTRRMRMVVQSPWYQERWRVEFSRDENLKGSFQNDAMGYRVCSGITGGVMGLGGDRIILDDPHDRDEAFSDVARQRAIDEYREKISTRLNNASTGAIVAIGQRLHEEDLLGYLMDELNFERLVIPMRYEAKHPYATTTGFKDPRRKEGELMCEERFMPKYVEEQEKVLGTYGAAGQYQQRPAPAGGGMFERDWFYPLVGAAPEEAERCRYWDRASTQSGGAYTVGLLMAMDSDGVFYVEDIVRDQLSPDKRNRMILATAEMDRDTHGPNVRQVFEQEGGSGGKEQMLYTHKLLRDFIVEADRPTGRGSKEVRAQPFAAKCEAGLVKLVRAPWTQTYLDEMATFPMGKYKDQVDASTGAFTALAARYQRTLDRDLLCSGDDPEEDDRDSRLSLSGRSDEPLDTDDLPETLAGILGDISSHGHGGNRFDGLFPDDD